MKPLKPSSALYVPTLIPEAALAVTSTVSGSGSIRAERVPGSSGTSGLSLLGMHLQRQSWHNSLQSLHQTHGLRDQGWSYRCSCEQRPQHQQLEEQP